jgi:hypothetical protein
VLYSLSLAYRGMRLLPRSPVRWEAVALNVPEVRRTIKQQSKAAKKAGWSGALGATSALLMFMMEGYAQGLEIAAAENSSYQQLVAALARVDLAEANRQADEFYVDVATKGGGSIAALNGKNAWDAAVCEVSKDSGD